VADQHARVSLRRTGGVAGLAMQASVDTRDLPDPQAHEILGILDGVDLASGSDVPPTPGAADRFQYELTVEREGVTHAATFSEEHLPAQLAPVVRMLSERATPSRVRRGPSP
jgi:hypothetical protein